MKHTNSLKILLVITKSNFGGAQRYVYDLARSLHSKGHVVNVVFGGDGMLAKKLQALEIDTITLPALERDVRLWGDIKTAIELHRIIRSFSPDVVHLNSSKIGGIGGSIARLINLERALTSLLQKSIAKIRIIFTGHGWAFNEERSDTERFVIGMLHWLTIMLAHRTIAVSARTKEQIAELPLVDERIRVIHNGIDEQDFVSKQEALQLIVANTAWEGVTFDKQTLVIGTIAELHNNKGLRYALEGIAQLKKQIEKPIRYIVIGGGEEEGSLRTLIKSLELEDTVLLAGYRSEAARLLRAFDIFLLPSITEAFPYVILEAGNAGLPIVATSVGGIPEVIDDMETGILIHSRNPGEISRALKFMIDNKERRDDFGKKIKLRIKHRFGLEEMVKLTVDEYLQD